eukprot:g12678.t1
MPRVAAQHGYVVGAAPMQQPLPQATIPLAGGAVVGGAVPAPPYAYQPEPDPANLLNPALYENHQFQSSRQVSFAATELAFYQNLHSLVPGADPHNGEIQGPEAAAFLAKSGLPKAMLHQIWKLADAKETGKLNLEELFIALRLVAHAQNTGLVHPELVHTEPMTLPSFESVVQKRTISEPSEGGETTSVIGGAIDESLQVFGTSIDPLKLIESSARREERQGYLARAQHNMSFNVTEQILYQKIFESLDPEAGEVVGTKKTSEFLESSSVPRAILHELWSIADEEGSGRLNRVQFFILLRLIAHAQAADNGMPGPGMEFVEPPSLPLFDPEFVLGMRGPGAGAPTAQATSPGAFYCEPLSKKEKKKYASIFVKTDENGDGFVEGDEAKLLMQRSRLPNEFLALCWQLADEDNDGRLSFPEFLIAMHLITRCKRGDFRPEDIANLPSVENALPGHVEQLRSETLEDALAGELTPSSVAVHQVSEPANATAASSPSATPQLESLIARSPEVSYLQAQSLWGATVPPGFATTADHGSGAGAPAAATAGTTATSAPSKLLSASITALGQLQPPSLSGGAEPSSSSTARYAAASALKSAAAGTGAGQPQTAAGSLHPPHALGGSSQLSSRGLETSMAAAASAPTTRDRLPRFGTGPEPKAISSTYLEDIAEADKRLAKRTQQEVDALEEQLKTLNDKFENMERELRAAQREQDRRAEQVLEREKQKEYLQQRLKTLTSERRATTVAAFSASSNSKKGYFAEETGYLEDAIRKQCAHVENVKEANSLLEKQFHQADLHLQQLERQRRELEKATQAEKEHLKQEERENSTLKTSLDGLQRKISVVNTNLALQQAEGSGAASILTSLPNLGVPSGKFFSAEGGAGGSGVAGMGRGFGAGGGGVPAGHTSFAENNGGGETPAEAKKRAEDTEELGRMGGHSWSGLLVAAGDETGSAAAGSSGALGEKPKTRSVLPRAFDREGV